ncbi:MAG: pentapeptide repeat-containing protein [Calothrix sp. MO_167.B42]|nr:pentapeptide repeat-containing protein [Calothrix sp. MO_167.B42]
MKKLKQVRESLTKELGTVVELGAETPKASLELAMALGWLNPAFTPVAVGLSFVGLTKKGLELYRKVNKKEPDIEEWVGIAFPLAYVESFDTLVQKNDWLRENIGAGVSGQEIKQQFDKLGEIQLDREVAQKALTYFPESLLGRALNQQLSTYLEQVGVDKQTIPLITGWVAWQTKTCVELLLEYEPQNLIEQLAIYTTAAQELGATQKFSSIESYLKEYVSPNPSDRLRLSQWQVFDEDFQIPDIYVPLLAQLLDSNGKVIKDEAAVNLETWAKEHLTNPETNSQVMFIQAGPGRGKSVFCRMFANWLRENFHPIWTPILIRLRDIHAFEDNLENTLRAAIQEDFTKSDDGWITDRNTRFLFILDGFDELRLEGRTSGELQELLKKVGMYQEQCGGSLLLGHRFLVTGREMALQGIALPRNLQRVEIALMDDEIQQQWFDKWGNLVGEDKAKAFQKFLTTDNCPQRVQELAREPLLLYLLGAMHRDGELTTEKFAGANGVQAKILIYQTTLDWVLTKQRSQGLNSEIDLNFEITEFETKDLRRILMEAGLCVTQSGEEWTSIRIIEERLSRDKGAKELLEKAQKKIGENPLRNALAAFYLRPIKGSGAQEGAVEFIHKSFGEFLCAQRLAETLEQWTWVNPYSRRKEFFIADEQLEEQIYNLFSYGGLTLEIVEYLMALLDDSEKFQPVELFERLQYFYLDWCAGKFINAYPKNLPFNQMQILGERGIGLGLREVDIYAGLNVMILLFKLHRYAQTRDELRDKINFYPCGQKGSKDFDEEQLLRVISYSKSFDLNNFLSTVGSFLSGADLSGTYLSDAYLSGADLSDAYLSGADLSGAYLREANLSGADLSRANLSGTDLSRANLSRANLSRANLSRAKNLTPEQIKSGKNWEKAIYDPEFRQQLGLPETGTANEDDL